MPLAWRTRTSGVAEFWLVLCDWATARPDQTRDENRIKAEHTNTVCFFPAIEITPL
jgi:hypothetical protein